MVVGNSSASEGKFRYSYDMDPAAAREGDFVPPHLTEERNRKIRQRRIITYSIIIGTTFVGVIGGIYSVAKKGYATPPPAQTSTQEGNLEKKLPR